ncbi:MAG TPA: hypothetical protein VE465_14185 [Streptosporangiaceae bacterium]|jgi:hypothetical protein|nr:hypothetical protein [Streptosporangiaceae bacterium]
MTFDSAMSGVKPDVRYGLPAFSVAASAHAWRDGVRTLGGTG